MPHKDNRLLAWRKIAYQATLLWALGHRKTVVAISLVAPLGSLGVARHLGTEFLPELDEWVIWVNIVLPLGISLSETQATTKRVRMALKTIPEVTSVISKAGRPDDETDPKLLNNTEYLVSLKPKSEWRYGYTKEDLVKEMDHILSTMPGIKLSFSQPIRDNVLESISQVDGQILIKVFGSDSEYSQRTSSGRNTLSGTECPWCSLGFY